MLPTCHICSMRIHCFLSLKQDRGFTMDRRYTELTGRIASSALFCEFLDSGGKVPELCSNCHHPFAQE